MFDILHQWWVGRRVARINKCKQSVRLPTSEEAISTASPGSPLIVLGNESSGKSSVLRRLIQLKIFQIGYEIETRFCLRVKLCFNAWQSTPLMTLRLKDQKPLVSTSADVIHAALKAMNDQIAASCMGVDADLEGVLEIQSNQVPNLELIDTPGLLTLAAHNEPKNLPEIIRNLICKYVKEDTVILHITDAKSHERNCSSYGLIDELCYSMNIKVVVVKTKIDCLVKKDLALFLNKFYKENDLTLAVSNYEEDTDTFAHITERETEFFQSIIPDYAKYKSRLGIDAVFKMINKIAKEQCRDEWAQKQYELETKRMQQLQALLENQGPLFDAQQLGNLLISEGLLYDDPLLDKFLSSGWQQIHEYLPSNSLWSKPADIPFEDFLQAFEASFIEKVKKAMASNPQKLLRFENFTNGFIARFQEKLNERKHYISERWTVLQAAIQLQHDMGLHYEKNLWLNAVKSCLYTEFFMKLTTGEDDTFLSLENQLMSFTIGLNTEEHQLAHETRQGLLLQIKELRERILPMLSCDEDQNESEEDSD